MQLYPSYGIAGAMLPSFLCNVKSHYHEYHVEQTSENTVVERPCILLQLYGGETKKKRNCCKNYKKDKACKKCPRD